MIPRPNRLARLPETMNWIKSTTFAAVLLTAAVLFGDDALNQFNAAKTAFDNKQYESARVGFETFLTRFPTHTQAHEATFYLAESLMYLRQYALAETYFNRLVALGLNDVYAKAALFRLAEIPYIQEQFDIAKPRLENFIGQLPNDINLQFVLYYLGDIAMRSSASDAAVEAEFYFEQANRIFPEGDKILESKLGLAWAKNKLGKVNEANAIYQQLMNSTNPAIVEQATFQYGRALFERESFQEAINVLTEFQRRYPASSYFDDSRRVIARCQGRLKNYEGGLQVLSQIANPTPDDLLMKVRCLFGLKRMQEAKTILDETKRVAGTLYRDEIALLESVFLFDQRDWNGTIRLLDSVLVPQFDANTNRMIVNYFSLPLAPGTKKLSEEAIFRACSLLTLAYARNGESAKATALFNEMQGQAALSGNFRLTSICAETSTQLADIGTTPGRGTGRSGGLLANRNERQWNPGNPTPAVQTPTLLTSGTDLEKFWNADRLYRNKNYEATVQQLEMILSGFYNQIALPPQYTIFYNITGETGTMDENTFARACSLLALAKAQLGNLEQANAVLLTLGSRIRSNDTVQQSLLRETYDQVAELAKGGTPAAASPSGSALSESEQRRLLRNANSLFRQQRYDQTDAVLTELIAHNPMETILTEALLVQSKTKYGLGWEQDGVTLLERIVDEFPTSSQYAEALWLLGLYYESGGDTFQSVEYFQILADRFQNFKHIDGALYFLAVDALANGNGRKAATLLNRVYHNHRNGLYWSHTAWVLAYEAYKKKEYGQAERYIQEILRHPPDVAIVDKVLYLRGELALRREDYETAFLAFKEVTKLDSPLSYYANQNAQVAARKTVNIL